MLGIGSRAAVAAREDLAVSLQTPNHAFGRFGDGAREGIHALQLKVSAFREVLADAADQVHEPLLYIPTRRTRRVSTRRAAARSRSAAHRTGTAERRAGSRDSDAPPARASRA